jgi:hypothetical protein
MTKAIALVFLLLPGLHIAHTAPITPQINPRSSAVVVKPHCAAIGSGLCRVECPNDYTLRDQNCYRNDIVRSVRNGEVYWDASDNTIEAYVSGEVRHDGMVSMAFSGRDPWHCTSGVDNYNAPKKVTITCEKR